MYEIVKTEYADGKYGGSDYGSSIRIVMRSLTHVMFVGYGVNIIERKYDYRVTSNIKICDKIGNIIDHKETIIDIFGEQSIDLLLNLKRGFGTILVDGGGDKLPSPSHVRKKLVMEEYESVTPTKVGLVPINKTCRFCGEALKPVLSSYSFDYNQIKDNPCFTSEDCQKFTNQLVYSIHGVDIRYKGMWDRISFFQYWDGETFHDDYFCSDKCAMNYGRKVVRDV